MDQAKKIKKLELEVENLKSRIRIDEKERTYREQLEFISATIIDFLSHSDQPDLYRYIGSKLEELLQDTIIVVSSYDPNLKELTLQYIGGVEKLQDRIVSILGRRPNQMMIPLTDKTISLMKERPNKLHKFTDGFHESSDGVIPKTVSRALEKLISANEMYGIVFERNEQIFGTATLITRGNAILEHPQLIETFIYQCSIAFHRFSLEKELRLAKKEAEQSSNMKTAFLANMSHEIRTPMNGILGLTSLLSNPDLTEKTRQDYLGLIKSSGNVLLNLLDGIMDISRIEANQVIINQEVFNLNLMITELSEYYLSELVLHGKKGIEMQTSAGLPEKDSWIMSDQVRLRQILVNLIGNAVKFTSKGKIEFGYRLRKRQAELEFFVSDTGPGVQKEQQELIFEQFVQGDYSSTREFGGSGLGLAICKGFLDLMGGRIWLDSTPGEGAVFYFTLPYERHDPSEQERDRGDGTMEKDWTGKRILVVEDDYINFKLLEGILKRCKATVLFAATGKEAVRLCQGINCPDLVLMDVQLPEMNGFEAIRHIRRTNPDIPIIVQTANALHGEKKKAEELGTQGFILKPVNLDSFLTLVGKYMDN